MQAEVTFLRQKVGDHFFGGEWCSSAESGFFFWQKVGTWLGCAGLAGPARWTTNLHLGINAFSGNRGYALFIMETAILSREHNDAFSKKWSFLWYKVVDFVCVGQSLSYFGKKQSFGFAITIWKASSEQGT